MDQSRYVAPTNFERWFYKGAQRLVEAFNRYTWLTTVHYEEAMPPPPYLLAPTHRSNIDTLLVGSVTRDPMTYMAKSGLFVNPAIAQLLRLLGGFPVDRGGTDRGAVEVAQAALVAGSSLVVFPEGTRRRGSVVEDLEEGVAYLALKAQVPIVPVGIAGSERAMPIGAKLIYPGAIAIEVGRAIYPLSVRTGEVAGGRTRRSEISRLTDILTNELNRLRNEAQHQRVMLLQTLA
ncbi:1-acyl-sn-glycerol-3-phosphate acyltransferase [Ferrimicrobium sp.]|jgi:1-acyl-sn-glycerol-3-phosphate acyltransferase|uniref:lysophospholipid acyltransferase family protein n=1 Tax=Ferrimicrobium sp. TaxID=2926050 RepID=UPI00261F7729|nr:lysophospholipid acyltransferase family protein [Ferrimicrobium sp.]